MERNNSAMESTPKIEIAPMPQRSEARHFKEDWTGKSSTVLRRKLQNRLNKRASRKRKIQDATTVQEEPGPEPGFHVQVYAMHNTSPLTEAVAQFQSTGTKVCMQATKRRSLTSAPSFLSYIHTPLPVDQKLLTLLHFNLVRALTRNILLIGCDPDEMSLDINSPFAPLEQGAIKASVHGDVIDLPPTLRPTTLQMTVPHHPEIDVFPFPRYRDNLILAGETIDDYELCTDMLYGVDLEEDLDPTKVRENQKRKCSEGPYGDSGRTGLIVWADPWLEGSWEVDEGFAKKYARLLRGCDSLLRSTNHWRAMRDEKRLTWDE